MENDLENRLQAALDACARMQDQRDQLVGQLKDATAQCGVMAELLRDAFVYIEDDQDHCIETGKPLPDNCASLLSRIDGALAGKLPGCHDTEWTDATSTPTAEDYRELQAQHDQLQSKYKAAMDALQVARDGAEWCSSEELDRIDALLAGQVPEQAVDAHPMQPILLDPDGCPRFKKNSAVEYLADGRLNEIACRGYSDEDMTQLAQLIGYSVAGFGDLSYVSNADYERAVAAAPKPEGDA